MQFVHTLRRSGGRDVVQQANVCLCPCKMLAIDPHSVLKVLWAKHLCILWDFYPSIHSSVQPEIKSYEPAFLILNLGYNAT